MTDLLAVALLTGYGLTGVAIGIRIGRHDRDPDGTQRALRNQIADAQHSTATARDVYLKHLQTCVARTTELQTALNQASTRADGILDAWADHLDRCPTAHRHDAA